MNRNEESHFAQLPHENIERSKFNIPFTHKTTLNAGKLVPFYIDQDILPGDTMKLRTSLVIRMTTPIYPVMDNCFADIYYFFIPNRIIWDHWKDFMGENRDGAWTQSTEYEIPQFTTPSGTGAEKGTIMDYMGIPINVPGIAFSKLPIRAYILTGNEWFRDQNLTAPYTEYKTDGDSEADNTNPINGGQLLPIAKCHDYFTSALPAPQKGSGIQLPLGTSAPVVSNGSAANIPYNSSSGGVYDGALTRDSGTGNALLPGGTPDIAGNDLNMSVDLTAATAATINALRLATQTQKILEKDARGGTRYTEVIRNHFKVESPDARQQRPEYLGGKRIPINMQQVAQTSSTDGQSPQGNTAAFSLTSDCEESFTKSFTEHGIILGLMAIRQDHTYQQGLNKSWTRRRRLDYYWPTLAHLGEQPILMQEIYATGTEADNDVFGYQERWAEYRYKPNRISGELRSTYTLPLDSWHYGDKYDEQPILSTEFINETPTYIDRTLAIPSTSQDQFITDIYVDTTAIRPMPVYSIPGLLDHF